MARAAKVTRNSEASPAAASVAASDAVDYGALTDFIGYALRRAQMRLYEDFFRCMKGTGISPALFSALILVERNPGLQQGKLGQALGVARSGAMTMVDRLERLGLVERRAAPHDRRAYGLHLTPKGERTAVNLRQRVSEHDKRIASHIDQAERQQLMRLLERIY